MSLVHTQDHSPGCSSAGPEHAARQNGEGSYSMPLEGSINIVVGVPTYPTEHLKALK